MWGCWHRVAWRNSPRPTHRNTQSGRDGERRPEIWHPEKLTGCLASLKSTCTCQLPSPQWFHTNKDTLQTLFTGCEANTGKLIPSALRNWGNNDDSSKRKKKGGGVEKKKGGEGPVVRENNFVKCNTGCQKGTSVSGNTSCRCWLLSMRTRACLSLLSTLLRWHGPDPRHKYTARGVGSSVRVRTVLLKARTPRPVVSRLPMDIPRLHKTRQNTHKKKSYTQAMTSYPKTCFPSAEDGSGDERRVWVAVLISPPPSLCWKSLTATM